MIAFTILGIIMAAFIVMLYIILGLSTFYKRTRRGR